MPVAHGMVVASFAGAGMNDDRNGDRETTMARPSSNRPAASTRSVNDDAARTRGQELTETIAGKTGNTLERAALLPGAPGTPGSVGQDGQPSPQTGQAAAGPAIGAEGAGSGESRHEIIARSAYYRAERRGFAPGYEVEDWLEAEREVLDKEGGTSVG
jgi:hypothetical protein